MYKAEILADSLSPQGARITTMKITFPRIVLAEFNTHRMFSRNSASSRAIPFKKMVKMIRENPFIPIAWQEDHKGMQGNKYITDPLDLDACIEEWMVALYDMIERATFLNESHEDGSASVTKQLCNRLLEPFMWHTVIVTATEWENFFRLRCPNYVFRDKKYRSKKDYLKNETRGNDFSEIHWLLVNESSADIHIQAIAELMWDTYNESKPKLLEEGQWHIPFGDNFDDDKVYNLWKSSGRDNVRAMIATARCARISYETLGDDPKIDYAADIKLHDRLIQDGHMSPFEHCARAMSDSEYNENYVHSNNMYHKGWCRNFKGFIQYRHIVESAN